ncbi:MAG: DUF2975 domain-containing protein [Mucilaginibacter sp.]
MKTKTQRILAILHIMAWIIFVGLCIQTAGTLTSFVVSLYKPGIVDRMYVKLNLSGLQQYDSNAYSVIVGFMISIAAVKAFIAYLTIKIFSTLNLSNPFSAGVAALVERISIVAFVAGLFAIVAASYSDWLGKNGITISYNWAAGELLMFAGVIFVIAQVFKRGIELQSEHDLTI